MAASAEAAETSAPAAPATFPGRVAVADRRLADALRALAIDAAEAADSRHFAPQMGMAEAATALWTRFHKFDAADPRWPDRDRFILSAGHSPMLLYAVLHLTGHAGIGVDALSALRQLRPPTAGTDLAEHPAIEAAAGPLGGAVGTGVGMALAERILAARFGRSLVDHRTWIIAGNGDLMAGISHEAASLAGHLRLEKLTVMWHDNDAISEAVPAPVCSDDALKRFVAYGWAVKRVDGHDPALVAASLSMAIRARKPTLIVVHTTRAEPETKAALGWTEAAFCTPPAVLASWRQAGLRGAPARRGWLKRLARHPQRAEFERVAAGRLPENFHESVAALKAELADTHSPLATEAAGERTLAALVAAMPELVGGSVGPAPVPGMTAIAAGAYGGRLVQFGPRPQAMAAAMNGMALHGGLIPFAAACLVASDCMRPALRLAAIMRQRVVHVLVHDGEAGAAHLPVEHLAGLRAVPNLHVFRQADALETAECWELALRRSDGPAVLVLHAQPQPKLRADIAENRCARGGYVLVEAEGARRATLIASGAEVALAAAARALLAADGVQAAIVSLPCWELFVQQDEAYRANVLGGVLRVGVEAASGFGWERWIGADGMFVGVDGFTASGPTEDVYKQLGLTAEAIAAAVRRRVAETTGQGRTERQ